MVLLYKQPIDCLVPVDSPSPGMQQSSQVRSIIALVPNPSHPTQIPHLRLLVPLGSIQEVPEAITQVHGSKDKNPWDNVTFSRLVIGSNFCHVFCVYLYGWHSWLVTHFCHSFSDHVQDLTRSCSGFHLLRDLVMATTTVCSLLVCP